MRGPVARGNGFRFTGTRFVLGEGVIAGDTPKNPPQGKRFPSLTMRESAPFSTRFYVRGPEWTGTPSVPVQRDTWQ